MSTTLLRIGVLADYPLDPLVPHLDMALRIAGLSATCHTGLLGQLRRGLDATGETSCSAVDVLIVAPQFDELGPADLLDLADSAAGTVGRTSGSLLFVLPPMPEGRAFGVGDIGALAGVAAEATRVREALRTKLIALPNVYLADAEDAVRAVGARLSYHPAAARPRRYTDDLFACLATQLARILGTRYGTSCQAVVFDADSVFGAGTATLREPVRELRRAGIRLAVRGAGKPSGVWASVASACPELVAGAETSVVDGRPVAEQLAVIAAALDVPTSRTVLVTADPELADLGLLLGDRHESWPGRLRDGGLFDRPAPLATTIGPVLLAETPAPRTDFVARRSGAADAVPVPDESGPSAPAVRFGIVAFGKSLPEPSEVAGAAADYTAELDRVRGWGYRRFHRAPDGVGLTDLAVAAGTEALAAAGVAASDVDLVVLAIADLAEYLYWDPAAATQARLGAHHAEAVLINQACGGGVAAFDLVAGKFAAHPGYRTALLIGANRVCEPYWNRMEINTSIYSDGAAAAVLRRDHGACRWQATEFITDGTYADFMRMDVGAAAHPFTPETAGRPRVRSPQDRLDEFFAGDVRKMFAFLSTLRARSREVVDAACTRVGSTRADLRRVIHFNDNARQLAELATELGIPTARTNVDIALDHGHVGCADQLLTLQHLLAEGDLTAGDLVALTSTSSGMHWICTLLRV
ncbi:3-oxoacyl-ACP synthase III family protein [Nocardia sp. NPDC050175]|uniref:3-oxoacyl-ACP synthase III family protein n=1 Tax=Nocardia sp. NPDC050175 TaxID=3364317 RepID=UPI0037B3E4F3